MKKIIDKNERIFIAGSNGMVGSSIKRALLKNPFNKANKILNLLTPSRLELDLLDSNAVKNWFKKEKPNIVILAAAKVGGLHVNSKYPTEFLLENIKIQSFNVIYELIDFIKNKMSGLLTPEINEEITGTAEVLDIFKVSKVGKVAGSKVLNGEINQDSLARVIRDGTIVFNGKVGSIFREKNQVKQVNAGLECGISVKDFNDFQIKDIIEAYKSNIIERQIQS